MRAASRCRRSTRGAGHRSRRARAPASGRAVTIRAAACQTLRQAGDGEQADDADRAGPTRTPDPTRRAASHPSSHPDEKPDGHAGADRHSRPTRGMARRAKAVGADIRARSVADDHPAGESTAGVARRQRGGIGAGDRRCTGSGRLAKLSGQTWSMTARPASSDGSNRRVVDRASPARARRRGPAPGPLRGSRR